MGTDHKRHFESGAATYAQARPTYPDVLVAWFAHTAPDLDLAVDVGCGTGQLSRPLAQKFSRVHASDVSRDQIAHAATEDGVTFEVGGADHINVADHTASLIVAGQAAHWFDLSAFYKEVRRISKPRAVIALITYGVFEVAGEIGARLDHFYWQEVHPFWPEGREHVENGYADLAFPFVREQAPPMAITRVWDDASLRAYIDTWSSVKRARQAGEGAMIEAALADFSDILGKGGSFEIVWPLTVIAGRVSV